MNSLSPLRKSLTGNKAISVVAYKPEFKALWDDFVSKAKNGVFLFYRDYMEYHSDRFQDYSLLFFYKDRLIGLFPANISNEVLYSHGGLTFGGVISGYEMTESLMMSIFENLQRHCVHNNITKIVYKAIPYIYHSVPADEDLYALFRSEAKLIGRNAASCIFLPTKRRFETKRREAINKAKRNDLFVKQRFDMKAFMKLVEQVVVERHGAKPTHTSEEMSLLANRFPDNIKLFASYKGDCMLAGCLIYESDNVAHGQYAANSDLGRTMGAQDVIIDYLVNTYYAGKKYFDFGISTLNLGRVLNEGLIAHKESFSANTVTYDSYELLIE